MALSRYRGSSVVIPEKPSFREKRTRFEQPGLGTFPPIDQRSFSTMPYIEHTITQGERLDVLARRYYGDGRYWWAICLTNGIGNPLDSTKLSPGSDLKIVLDINQIVDVVNEAQSKKRLAGY